MQEEKSFYQTCQEAVTNNKDVQLTLQALKEECLAAASSGKGEIRFGVTYENEAAIKVLERMLPVVNHHWDGSSRFVVLALV